MAHHDGEATAAERAMEVLSEEGLGGMGKALELLLNEAMRAERAAFLGAVPNERTTERVWRMDSRSLSAAHRAASRCGVASALPSSTNRSSSRALAPRTASPILRASSSTHPSSFSTGTTTETSGQAGRDEALTTIGRGWARPLPEAQQHSSIYVPRTLGVRRAHACRGRGRRMRSGGAARCCAAAPGRWRRRRATGHDGERLQADRGASLSAGGRAPCRSARRR